VALRWPVKRIPVAVAAMLGIAYTVPAGAEVPTVRTILVTLIVLFGMVIGREAFSLRLLAAAAIMILAVRPEALLSASFQLRFAAVIALVALYESPIGRRLATPLEDESPGWWLLRQGTALLVTGLAAELALSSIGLFHFNRAVFEPARAEADIVISDRRMPGWCQPRWQRFDRERLAATGAVAVWLDTGRVVTASDRIGDHPWRPKPSPQRKRR